MEEDFNRLLERLLRISSATEEIAGVRRVTFEMEKFLAAHGLFCQVEECAGRSVLYAGTRPGEKCPDVLFNAHLDTVPARSECLVPRREGDRLYARGAVDCKGCCVAIARVLTALVGSGISAGAFFSTDEETGGDTTAAMAARGYGAKRGIVVLDADAYAVAYAQKGILSVKLTAHGRSGHASEPWRFESAIDVLLAGYAKIRAAWPTLRDPDHWEDTLAATVIEGGTVANGIPDTASLTVNIRFVTPDGDGKILELLRRESGLEVTLLHRSEPFFTDPDSLFVKSVRAALAEKFPGRTIELVRMHGATDARHLASLGVPIAILGLEGGNMHGDGEWVSLSSLHAYAEALTGWLRALK